MLGSILIFLLVLSVLIFIHEFGHFIVAKKSGVLVEEFGFGIPPRIFGKKVKGTIYSINLLPFGGFVKLHGENTVEKVKHPEKAFLNKDKKTRIAIVVAGVIMNFLLAVFAFAIVYSFTGIPRDTQQVRVVEVLPGTPAQTAKIVVGDVVKSVDGQEVDNIDNFINLVSEKKGQRILLLLERNIGETSEDVKVRLIPRENPPEEEGPLGVIITSTETYYPPIWQRPFVGIYYGLKEAFYWGWAVLQGLTMMVVGLFSGKIPTDVSGPVGIFAVTTEAARYGFLSLLNFMAILSVNLAILNIIPFPALDGGRLLFIIIEAIFGKKVSPKIESIVHSVGMIVLITLLISVTVRDVQRLIIAGSISNFLDSIVK